MDSNNDSTAFQDDDEIQFRPESQWGGPTTGSQEIEWEELETRPSHIPHENTFTLVWSQVKRFRLVCGAIVNHEKVQISIVTLIGINAIMMGVTHL